MTAKEDIRILQKKIENTYACHVSEKLIDFIITEYQQIFAIQDRKRYINFLKEQDELKR